MRPGHTSTGHLRPGVHSGKANRQPDFRPPRGLFSRNRRGPPRLAAEKGVTIDELISESDDADHEIDGFQKKLGKTEDNIIVEGKIAWRMIPQSFKILVTVREREGARREELKQRLAWIPREARDAARMIDCWRSIIAHDGDTGERRGFLAHWEKEARDLDAAADAIKAELAGGATKGPTAASEAGSLA